MVFNRTKEILLQHYQRIPPCSILLAQLGSFLWNGQSGVVAEESTLEMFAPELQLQILLNAATPDNLHALLRASPRLYQVFLLNKETVLSAVARRQFHPAVISDALFFANISQLEQPLPRDFVLESCRSYPNKLDEGTVIPIPISTALCKLARNLRFFIQDYTQNSLPLMTDLGRSLDVEVLPEYQPENPVSDFQLSDSETGRLQRAFCRFEIYRHLFARCSAERNHNTRRCDHSPPVTPAEQGSLFLEQLSDFQVTEINCIRDYLYRRLRGIFNQLEENALATLSPENFVFDEDGDVEYEEWTSGVWFFTKSGKRYQDQHIEHLMSLGLAYIRQIFESTGDKQKSLFLRDDAVVTHAESDFITRALDLLGLNPAGEDVPLIDETDPPFVYKVNADVALDIPDAWQWAYPQGPPVKLSEFYTKGLRDWGFVFWDMGRLRESGILERR